MSQLPPGVTVYAKSQPQNYLVLSILTTFFCCFILGIMAIIYSNKVGVAWPQTLNACQEYHVLHRMTQN